MDNERRLIERRSLCRSCHNDYMLSLKDENEVLRKRIQILSKFITSQYQRIQAGIPIQKVDQILSEN